MTNAEQDAKYKYGIEVGDIISFSCYGGEFEGELKTIIYYENSFDIKIVLSTTPGYWVLNNTINNIEVVSKKEK